MLSPKAVHNFVPLVDVVARDFVETVKKKMLESAHGSLSMDAQSNMFNYTTEGVCGLGEGSSLREAGTAEATKEGTTLRAVTALLQ